jgi:hypothetical protein
MRTGTGTGTGTKYVWTMMETATTGRTEMVSVTVTGVVMGTDPGKDSDGVSVRETEIDSETDVMKMQTK